MQPRNPKLPSESSFLPSQTSTAYHQAPIAMTATPRVRDKELWPYIVDRLAKEQPEATYGLWPVTTDSYDAGFRAITYGQLANVVNGLAWWIVNQLGRGNAQEGDVLTYIGLNDVRLTGMILASVKAGYTVSYLVNSGRFG